MKTKPTTQRLFRPIGLIELELILDSNCEKFPPRLDWQPIFYPVMNQAYAAEIASKWNTKDQASGYSGFVTAFDVDSNYLSKFEIQNVGGEIHNELWVPSEELANFNSHIQGKIQLVEIFYGNDYQGLIKKTHHFKGLTVEKQLSKIELYLSENKIDADFIATERDAFISNFKFWTLNTQVTDFELQIRSKWKNLFSDFNLV